jgi:hypothetical protein
VRGNDARVERRIVEIVRFVVGTALGAFAATAFLVFPTSLIVIALGFVIAVRGQGRIGSFARSAPFCIGVPEGVASLCIALSLANPGTRNLHLLAVGIGFALVGLFATVVGLAIRQR